MPDLPSVGFIGAGRAAWAIAPALEAAGYRVPVVSSRSHASAEALAGCLKACKAGDAQDVADAVEIVFLTVTDGAIEGLARQVAWQAGQTVVHCSGALTLAPLAPVVEHGAKVGSWHPLQTFAGRGSVQASLTGVTVGIEASADVYPVLADMASRVGAVPIAVPAEARALYHAAAVMSCGFVAALLDQAAGLWERAGLSRAAAVEALGKLAESTVMNVRAVGPRAALTGPAVRGDVDTVRLHLNAIASSAPGSLSLYRELVARSVELAEGGSEWKSVLNPSAEV